MHDPRVGRFLSTDPLEKNYAFFSPYQFGGNRPIDMVEIEGLEMGRFTIPQVHPKIKKFTFDFTISTLKGGWNLVKRAAKNPNHAGYGYEPNMQAPTEKDFAEYDVNWPVQLDPYYQIQSFSESLVHGTTGFITGLYELDGAKTAQSIPDLASSVGVIFGAAQISRVPNLLKYSNTAKMYRVQGGIGNNASKLRFEIKAGKLSVDGNDMLYVTFNDESRALNFLAKRGDEAYLLEIKVDRSILDRIKKDAVNQVDGKANPGKPQRVDQTKTNSSFGIPKEYFEDLLNSIQDVKTHTNSSIKTQNSVNNAAQNATGGAATNQVTNNNGG